jgi:hypothetical protein
MVNNAQFSGADQAWSIVASSPANCRLCLSNVEQSSSRSSVMLLLRFLDPQEPAQKEIHARTGSSVAGLLQLLAGFPPGTDQER